MKLKWKIESMNDGLWSTESYCEDYQDAKDQLKTYMENVTDRPIRLAAEVMATLTTDEIDAIQTIQNVTALTPEAKEQEIEDLVKTGMRLAVQISINYKFDC